MKVASINGMEINSTDSARTIILYSVVQYCCDKFMETTVVTQQYQAYNIILLGQNIRVKCQHRFSKVAGCSSEGDVIVLTVSVGIVLLT